LVNIRCQDMTFSGIEAIIFDKDGTLADSESFLRNLGQRRSRLIDAKIPGVQEPLLMAFGIEGDRMNPAGLMAIGTRRDNEIASAAYVAETGRDWIESLQLVQAAFAEADRYVPHKADHTPLFADSLDTLQRLAIAGVKLGILSADTSDNVLNFVKRYDLQDYLQLSMGIDDGPGKPDPGLLHQACSALNVSPQATLMVGDSIADVQMAVSAQVAGCIAIVRGRTDLESLKQANVLINQLNEIQICA